MTANALFSSLTKSSFITLHLLLIPTLILPAFDAQSIPMKPNFNPPYSLFVQINPGTFTIGSPVNEPGRYGENQSQVTLTQLFEIQMTEVTQAQWFQIMGNNPSYFSKKEFCPDSYLIKNQVSMCVYNPVENVSWYDTQYFFQRLNLMNDGYFYRLPTEAEWEYAARGGTSSTFSFGNNVEDLVGFGWFAQNSNNQSHKVATKKPNPFGLFDMHGNVFEWVLDWYNYSTPTIPQKNPMGPPNGTYKVLRSGSWYSYPLLERSAARNYQNPNDRYPYVGFRTVRIKRNQ